MTAYNCNWGRSRVGLSGVGVDVHEDGVDRILAEYLALLDVSADDELAALGAAIFIEDAFGIVVPEDLLTPAELSSEASRARTVRKLLGLI